MGHPRLKRGPYCALKRAEIVFDGDTLFLELRRSGCAALSGRAASRREQDKAPAASHQQRLGSTLPASPVHFRHHWVPHDQNSKRLHPSSPLPGALPEVCPPLQTRGEPAAGAGQGWAGSRRPHLFHFEPCGTSLQTAALGLGGSGRASSPPEHPPGAVLCPRPLAARHFAVPSPPSPSPPCRGTRRSSRRFLAAMKCTKWKFNRPVVCVVEISGSCLGIFYDTFVYVGEA